MSEQLKESLSAVMDGEADEFEIRRVLNEAAEDSELRGVWERYHLVSSVIRGEGRKLGAGTLGWEFWAQIDAEAATTNSGVLPVEAPPESVRNAPRWAWIQRIAGIGVAAGVAAAVIIVFGARAPGDDAATLNAATLNAATLNAATLNAGMPTAQVSQIQQSDIQTMPAAFDDEQPINDVYPSSLDLQRAQAYMLHHAHQVALTNQTRTVPFVKVAAFQSR
jgi:sigma-E factor negative regulatory protein RseA